MMSYQTEKVRHAGGSDVVTVDVQVPQRAGAVVVITTRTTQCSGDALQTSVVQPGATQHQ